MTIPTKPPAPITNPKKALGAVAKRFGVSKSDIRDEFGGVGNFVQAALATTGTTLDDVKKLQMAASQARLDDAEKLAARSVAAGMKFADGGEVPPGGDNRKRAKAIAAGVIRNADGERVSPTDLSWRDAGAPYRAPAHDPVTDFTTLTDQVTEAAKMSGLPGLHNGPADAYRHSLWTAAMTRKYGPNAARLIGLANEIYGAGKSLVKTGRIPFDETMMDLKNNETGIRLAREAIDDRELWRRVRDLADRTNEPLTYGEAFALLTDDKLVNFPPADAYELAVVAAADPTK
jgi:hypothetical protein